jgi:hypothetical protein
MAAASPRNEGGQVEPGLSGAFRLLMYFSARTALTCRVNQAIIEQFYQSTLAGLGTKVQRPELKLECLYLKCRVVPGPKRIVQILNCPIWNFSEQILNIAIK